MKIPITRYGLPQALVYPALVLIVMILLFIFLAHNILLIGAEIFLFVIMVWMISFFRDPPRKIAANENVLLSPADGIITDITETEISELGGKALCIGMFLSIYNVHINRMPCSVSVEAVYYKKGVFKSARSNTCGRENESNDLVVKRTAKPLCRMMVRQISGAVARRIVCRAVPGSEYRQGETFGMIKFGSRTELYLPLDTPDYTIAVKKGDRVNAGLSPLIVFKS